MCGRFTLRTSSAAWRQLFLIDQEDAPTVDEGPRYNVAPTQTVAAVVRLQAGGPRQVLPLRWGLVPAWAKDLAIGNRMINARGETVDTKPSFRAAFRARRCLIPADGFYEWKKEATGKQPYLIEPAGNGLFAFAGLWEENHRLGTGDTPLRTCTIITTSANSTMSSLHDRMPVLIEPEHHDRWLDPANAEVTSLKELLHPAADDAIRVTPVSKHVNRPGNDDPECIRPLAAEE